MKIKSVFSPSFAKYGQVLTGYDTAALCKALEEKTPRPADSVVYVPGEKALEDLPIFQEFTNGAYGGMPIQIGYCNGFNTKLNCLEYHRGSELNIATSDMILLLATISDVKNGKLNTKKVEAFRAPAGVVVEVFETTLHYAPCCDVRGNEIADGFRVAIVLPKDTNTGKPDLSIRNTEDKLLWAKNKWLIAHPDSSEAKQGAFVGLSGKNIDIAKQA